MCNRRLTTAATATAIMTAIATSTNIYIAQAETQFGGGSKFNPTVEGSCAWMTIKWNRCNKHRFTLSITMRSPIHSYGTMLASNFIPHITCNTYSYFCLNVVCVWCLFLFSLFRCVHFFCRYHHDIEWCVRWYRTYACNSAPYRNCMLIQI